MAYMGLDAAPLERLTLFLSITVAFLPWPPYRQAVLACSVLDGSGAAANSLQDSGLFAMGALGAVRFAGATNRS